MRIISTNGVRLQRREKDKTGLPSRALAWVLTLCMILTLAPALAFAEEGTTVGIVAASTTHEWNGNGLLGSGELIGFHGASFLLSVWP